MQLNEKQKFKREINEAKKIFAYQYIYENRPKGIIIIQLIIFKVQKRFNQLLQKYSD